MYAVIIPQLNVICFTESPPGDEIPWEVIEDADLNVPFNVADYVKGTDPHQPILTESTESPGAYKLFRRMQDVEASGYRPVNRDFGGLIPRREWASFRDRLKSAVEVMEREEDGDEPDELMDEVARSLKGEG